MRAGRHLRLGAPGQQFLELSHQRGVQHVDWGADAIEHVLDAELVAALEKLMPGGTPAQMPNSPHRIAPMEGEAA